MIKDKDIIITKLGKKAKARIKNFRNFNDVFIEDLAKDKKQQEAYLEVALEDFEEEGNLENFLLALRTITKANGGFSKLAKDANLNRQSLYKSLSSKGNPTLITIDKVLNSLGFKLAVRAV